jgi:signal peptidase I
VREIMASETTKTYQKRKRKKQSSEGQWFWKLLSFCLFLLIVGIFFRQTLMQLYRIHPIEGTSMEPALNSGEIVLVSKQTVPQRYSLISFSLEKEQFVKRVIGVPGDAFFIQGTRMVFDLDGTGKFLTTYSLDIAERQANEWKNLSAIPEDCYFVLGDHLEVSKDSRVFGWVTSSDIEGTVLLKN